MQFIDTHTHLYLENFNNDRKDVIENAIRSNVTKMLLPAIDSSTYNSMIQLANSFPDNCLPMIGLHPTSVKETFMSELDLVKKELTKSGYIGIGEIGIDLYWDDTFIEEQKYAFRIQLQLAKEHNLPVAIHQRDSFSDIYPIIKEEFTDDLYGVFHCFTGNLHEAKMIMDLGFKMGIGGIVTFKKAGLAEIVADIPLEHLLLETDSPFLTPAPYRGKRNESAYLTYIAEKISEVKNIPVGEVAEITSATATQLFRL